LRDLQENDVKTCAFLLKRGIGRIIAGRLNCRTIILNNKIIKYFNNSIINVAKSFLKGNKPV